MNEFPKLTVGSWLSALVLASALGAVGCGDNSTVDRLPRQTPTPFLPVAENVQPPAEEFFIPGGDDIPDLQIECAEIERTGDQQQ